MKRIVFIFILTFLTSCNASYNSFYFYDEPTYATKEKELTISTEQAAYLFAESYFKEKLNDFDNLTNRFLKIYNIIWYFEKF